MRALFVLPGLHRVRRGAEVAFEAIARELALQPGYEVTLIGGGTARNGEPYRYRRAGCISRERFGKWPRVPLLRSEFRYEELSFLPQLYRQYDPGEYDVTVTCSYPFSNWLLRSKGRRPRPAHVYVTQNGDWPAHVRKREYRWFGCDGLVCTNPEILARNRDRWPCVLIPNGFDPAAFYPGAGDRRAFGLPESPPLALLVSALAPGKRVLEGIRCVARVKGLHLVVAGDGPLSSQVDELGRAILGTRYRRVSVPHQRMPDLYRCADCLLHMCQDEPFGNVYVEAMASGLPVVAHDSDKTRWIVEDGGQLVDTSDFEGVAEAIDAALSESAREAARTRVERVRERFAWSVVARRYGEFFAQVVQQRSQGSRSSGNDVAADASPAVGSLERRFEPTACEARAATRLLRRTGIGQ